MKEEEIIIFLNSFSKYVGKGRELHWHFIEYKRSTKGSSNYKFCENFDDTFSMIQVYELSLES